jgi:two-component system, OmpR family, response regulator
LRKFVAEIRKQNDLFMIKKMVKKIFVVDDDELVTTVLEDYLTKNVPHAVKIFRTGEDCLTHIETVEEPDIIILDYKLNSINERAADGLFILEEIKKLDMGIRVFMLSSSEAYGTALQTISAGAEEYLIKDLEAFKKLEELCNS